MRGVEAGEAGGDARTLPSLAEQTNQSKRPELPRLVGGETRGSQIEGKPTSTPTGSPSPIGTVVGRRYEIVEFLGTGKLGKAFLARDRLTEAMVALKRFRTDTEKHRQAAEMAMKAAELVAAYRHETIVRVFDVGEDVAGPYIVSEYIDGPDASRLVASQGAMSLRQAVRIIETIGQAVAFAHERGFFHGSVRGGNILFADDKRPMLSDFGLGGLDKADHARAKRQDVKGLARTLCQLLTGVSSGSVDVRDLPEAVQPAVRAALGTSVTARQPTVESFLRELRATELDLGQPPEGEEELIGRARRAELSGSFAAMREAGEEALQKNSESAEAMVVLRRADQLKSERDELMKTFRQHEQDLNYAGALDTLTKLLKRFPADHQAQRLGPKRETLAELTRLSGIAEQLCAAGHVGASLDTWRRISELSPADERARSMAQQARRARLRRRVASTAGVLVVLTAVGGAGGYFAWDAGYLDGLGIPGLTPSETLAGADGSGATDAVEKPTHLPMTTNPLVRTPSESGLAESTKAGTTQKPATEDLALGAETQKTETPVIDIEAQRREAQAQSAALAKRDALAARRHAEQSGATGLASAAFESALAVLDRAESQLEAGEYASAEDSFGEARGAFVSAAAKAGAAIAEVRGIIGERRFRDATRAIERLAGKAPAAEVESLRHELERARGTTIELASGVELPMRYIEPGVFVMGSPEGDPERRFGEDPHQVRIEKGYWLMATELTRGQLAAIRGVPEMPDQPDLPAVGITIDEARTLAQLLGERFGGTFAIPTEAQWEYACLADREKASEAGWSVLDSAGLPREAGARGANPWGLSDMLGNAAELVISNEPTHGERVVMTRGGSYLSTPSALRAAARHELVQRDRPDERVGVRFIWSGEPSSSQAQANTGSNAEAEPR